MPKIKKFLGKLFRQHLFCLARLVIKKHQPVLIGLAGSVYPFLTQESLACVLGPRFGVARAGQQIFYDPKAPLLAVLQQKNKPRTIWAWFVVLLKAWWLICFKKDYPKVLLLDVSQMKDCEIEVLPWRLSLFSKINQSLKEKSQALLNSMLANSVVLVSSEVDSSQALNFPKKCVTFGSRDKGQISLNSREENLAKSRPQKKSFCAAKAVGLIFDLRQDEIEENLADFKLPVGVLNKIKGIKKTILIDDTWQANPEESFLALDYLASFEGRKIAVLGDMLDLGKETEKAHRQLGKKAAQKVDILWTVGTRARVFIAKEAKKAGLQGVREFDKSQQAGKPLQEFMRQGDIVLVQGSRDMKMEKIIKEVKGAKAQEAKK